MWVGKLPGEAMVMATNRRLRHFVKTEPGGEGFVKLPDVTSSTR
jgi:hypothetical protein